MAKILDITQSAAANETAVNNKFQELEQSGGGTVGNRKLKVLILGNSYSCDAWSYVPFMLKEYGVDIILGIYYVAGQGIGDMVTYYNENAWTPSGFFVIDTSTDTAWQTKIASGEVCTHDCVVYDDWDIIAVQQAHTQSGNYAKFGSDVSSLLSLIRADMGDKAWMFGWSINHIAAADTQEYYISTLNNIRNACEMYPVDIVFPCGTAIMDAQKNSTLNVYGNNLLNDDGVHLNEGLPCYIAALANVEALFRKVYPWLSVLGDTTRPTATWLVGKNIPGQQGTSIGFGENDNGETNAYVAQKMAIMAVKHQFQRIGGNCIIHLDLTNCTSPGTTSIAYGSGINRAVTPNAGYSITSCRWRRASDDKWYTSNIYILNGSYYLQMYILEDIYVEAVAGLSNP